MREYGNQRRVPDDTSDLFSLRLGEQELARAFKRQLLPEESAAGAIVWVDGDSEVVVEVDRLRLALKPGLVIVELVMAADGVGERALVVPFRVGRTPADAALLAITEGLPRGNSLLSNRWGAIVQSQLWEALQSVGRARWLAQANGGEQMVLSGIYTDDKQLSYLFSAPVSAQEVADYFEQPGGLDGSFDPVPVELPERDVKGCPSMFVCWIAALWRGLRALARFVMKLLCRLSALISRRG